MRNIVDKHCNKYCRYSNNCWDDFIIIVTISFFDLIIIININVVVYLKSVVFVGTNTILSIKEYNRKLELQVTRNF